MELDAAFATLEAATASVVGALRVADLTGVSRDQLVSVVESVHRAGNTLGGVQTVAVAHLAAVEDTVDGHGVWGEQHRGLGHLSLDTPGLIAPVLGITAPAASTLGELAVHQVSRTPRLVDAMLSGDLDPWRARVVTTEVEICPDDTDRDNTDDAGSTHDAGESDDRAAGGGAGDLVDDLLEHYAGRGRGWYETAGPLRGRVRRMVARAHPDLVEKEAAAAREGRSVRRSPAALGTDHWEADLPVEVSLPMWQAVEALARELKNADPTLMIGQARADALAQLVLQQADITVHLHGTVPDTTEATAEEAPGVQDTASAAQPKTTPTVSGSVVGGRLTEVGGLGSTQPTLLDLDRLASARGVRVVPSTSLTCHPDTGAVIGGVVPASLARLVRKDAARRSDRYVVPADMARMVRLRDGRCRFPNCVIPASKTDQDHVIPWPVGATTPTNLMCLCRRHHRVKQRRGWQARLDPDGVVHWSDPTGRVTTTNPINHLDRATLPLQKATTPREGSSEPTDGDTNTEFDTELTFREIVHTHLRDLDNIPSTIEDHFWRDLELTHPGTTLGCLTVKTRPDEPKVTWWHPADRITLELATVAGPQPHPAAGDAPPF